MSDYNPFTLVGKTILVTGASSGIGRTISIECSKMGATVILTGRNEERINESLSMLEGSGHRYFICDFDDSNAIVKLAGKVDIIDGLVNNAGFTITKPIPFINDQDLSKLLQVNTIAPILLLKELIKKKKVKREGSIVFTSSIAGILRSSIGNSMYASTKGAISAFVRVAAKELAPRGIRVNAVCPAMVDTGILVNSDISQEQLNADRENYPLKRYGLPTDVAWATIYLLSNASNWVTGSNLVVDGGISIK